MSTFIQWLPTTIGQWWTFLASTNVPQCNFTFGTLFLFLIAFSLIMLFIDYAMHYRTKSDKGGKK